MLVPSVRLLPAFQIPKVEKRVAISVLNIKYVALCLMLAMGLMSESLVS